MRVNFIFIQFILTYVFGQNQQVGFVYNSIPYKSFDVHSINGTSSRIKVSQQTGIAIVALGKAGIMIIDNKFNTHIHQSPDKSYIQCVQISKNGQYIFLGMVGQVGIFQLDQIDFSIKIINTINVQNMTIVDIQFNLEEEIMFVVGYLGVLKWYDSRNITNLIQLGIIDYSQDQILFDRGAMPPDDRFFYIAADFEGLIVFRIDKSLQNNQLQVNLTKILTKLAATSFTELVVTSKNNYVFAIDRWNGIFIIYDLSQLILDGDDVENQNNQLIKMVPANLGSTLGYTSSIGLSLDDQFLYVGARSLGILIYNIQDPLNPQFFQQLQLTGQSFSIALSPKQNVISNTTFDNQFIYYSNSLSVAIYEKQKPSLFNNIPNLFNAQQSQFFIEGTAVSKWRCAISSNNKYFLGGLDADGLSIFEIKVNSYTKSTPSTMQIKYQFSDTQQQILRTNQLRVFGPDESIPLGFYVDNIYFSKDGQYIYFAAQQSTINVIAYKFKVIISPDGEYSFEYVKGLHYDQVYYCEEMNFSEDEQHAVMSFDVGIVLVDMIKFEVISMYTNQGIIGTCCGAVLSHDKKHALAVVRNVGLFIYDTSDMANPKMVNQWRTNGGETLLRSQVNQIIYFLDGFNGMILLDSTKLPEIVVIGSYISSGWTNFISFTNDERYGIISTMDSGTLTLIDLTDKSNLRVIMKSIISSQNSIATCIDKTGLSFLFSMNQHQFRLYNLQSQVQIHVERQVQSISTLEYTSISDIEPFQVGLQYLVRFVVLYRQPNQVISQIYYYQNLVLQSLPSWMTVDRSDQSNSNLQALLQLNIPKECLDSNEGNKSFLTIVIQSCFQLDANSFIFETTELITTQSESTSIFNYLKQAGYIDGMDCATNFFDSTIKKYIDLTLVFATKSEIKFLKLKSDIVTQKTLQDQMNKQGTDLTIEESFMIQFDIASFIDPDQIPLSYQFQQQISGQFVPISSDSFIKCDNVNLRLVGTNKLKKSILNLESVKSEKIINVQQNIQIEEKYKQVEGDLCKVAQQKEQSETPQNNSNILNKNRQFVINNSVNQDESISYSKKQINETAQSQFSSQFIQKEKQSKQNGKMQKQSKLKKMFKDKYDRRFSIQLQEIEQKKQTTEQVSQSGNFRNAENKNNLLNKYTIQAEDGTFQMSNLFNQMVEQKLIIQYELLDYKIEDYTLDLENEDSRFYQCLKANVLRYLLDNEKKTLRLYQFLKKYSLETCNYLQNDWYKQYVQITATNDLDQYGVHVPFSKTTLIEDEIFKVVKDLEIIPKNLDLENYKLSYLQSIDINPYLLKEVLFADALGLNFISSKSIIKCCGESIHLEKNQVVSVEAFEKIQDGVCLCLRKLFNLQYKTLPISKYISLPSWMSYEFKNGVIILEGIPTKSDVNNFLIRVYNQTRFVSYQFHLNVVGDSKPRDDIEVPQLENQIKESNFIKESDARKQMQCQQENMEQIQLGNNIINNSKKSQLQMPLRKQQNIVDLFSIKNSPNQTQNLLKNEQEENVDEIEEKAYTGIRSMTEYDQELTSPPIFPLGLGIMPNTPLSSFKLNAQIPNFQLQEQFDKQKDFERVDLQSKFQYEKQLNKELYDYKDQQKINKQKSNQNQN
ncbi:two component regulator propeller family protein (macronuclear) [Tetrahymena thermophila SB210]|uniref:Two component regulator propeller family protein n=1 Tax=Tetrahymena thermophila (strain SB210) TaxID=312017 RepID=W7XJR0_TETTS|nr:two component regulator propeller family protein [Tetrahymena thermophila SB210]EWS75831.1 two component regulator propeller family protein [Tetrahymena thermophila SB210]|eukprot:XP_012651645.1 two component regulator propeller family protein [Tetrahymena thermophila SB210]